MSLDALSIALWCDEEDIDCTTVHAIWNIGDTKNKDQYLSRLRNKYDQVLFLLPIQWSWKSLDFHWGKPQPWNTFLLNYVANQLHWNWYSNQKVGHLQVKGIKNFTEVISCAFDWLLYFWFLSPRYVIMPSTMPVCIRWNHRWCHKINENIAIFKTWRDWQ